MKYFKNIKKDLLRLWDELKASFHKVFGDFWDHGKHVKSIDRWLSILNTALVLLIAVLVIAAFINIVGTTLRNIAENFIEQQFVTRIVDIQDDIYGEGQDSGVDLGGKLISSSLTDIFSGTGWINGDQTTMFHDQTAMAFLLPPNFDWQRANTLTLNVNDFVERDEDGSDRRCLGSFCLVQQNSDLYMAPRTQDNYTREDYRIDLPESVEGRNLVNLSVGVLDTRWLVGVVEQSGGEYVGKAYYFNGEEFDRVFEDGPIFESRYQGTIGFGGADDDFLIVYGSYDGEAFRVRSGQEPVDVSGFFEIRVMDDGFHPVVIRSDNNGGSWYVFSLTRGTPKLVKLFENGTGEIVGATDLTRFLFTSDTDMASFYFDPDSGNLKTKIEKTSGDVEYWEFVDHGFDKSESLRLQSTNINTYPGEVKLASISNVDFSERGADVRFYLSNNGTDWYRVDIGEEFAFPDNDGRRLFWRMEVDPDGNSGYSPFISLLRLNYKVQF